MKVKKRSLFLFISLAGIVMVYFTNCAGGLEMSAGLNTLCINKDCYSSSKNKLALKVNEPLYLEEFDYEIFKSTVMATTVEAYEASAESGSGLPFIHMCTIDVGGACNDGGYVDNIIEWELLNTKKSCSIKSTWLRLKMLRINQYESSPDLSVFEELDGKCINGYFNVKVMYPCTSSTQATDMNLLSKNFGYFWQQGPKLLRLSIKSFDDKGLPVESSSAYDAELTLNFPGNAVENETCPD